MSIFESATVFLTLTALFAYLNKKFVKLPSDIGVMTLSLLASLLVLLLDVFGISNLKTIEVNLINKLDFSQVLLDVMLSILLFAGAMHIRSKDLKTFRVPVTVLAFFGTLMSTFIVGMLTYWLMPLLNINIPLVWCLLFGALISPTDPIAVMGILSSAGVPKSLVTVISGESLYNDGVGVVIFALIFGVVSTGEMPSVSEGFLLFAEEAAGGIIFGYIIGYVTYFLLKSIDSYEEEILITLAAVLGGYALAKHLHVSGPLAMVVVGLIVGNKGRVKAMSIETRAQVDAFWGLLDKILNSVLFVLIGLEVVAISYSVGLVVAAIIAIVIALFSRVVVVGSTTVLLGRKMGLPKNSWKVLTWGGLRGGISIALVLSLPDGPEKNILLCFTYGIVVFSILLQGLTVGKLAKRTISEQN